MIRGEINIASAEAAGFTHVAGRCSRCRFEVRRSFWLLRARSKISGDTGMDKLVQFVRCPRCQATLDPDSIEPWKELC